MPVAVFSLFFTSQEINIRRSPNATKLHDDFFMGQKEGDVGERSNFKKNPTHTQDHGDA